MSTTTINTTFNTNILCIPLVFANIGEDRIRRAFAYLDIGEVIRVDIVAPKFDATPSNNKKFNRVFIHINWNNTRQADAAKEDLSQGKDIKVVYQQPWFWKVSAYKKKEQEEKSPQQKEEEYQQKKNSEAAAALLASFEIKQVSTFVMNPDIRLMIATYLGIGRDEVSEEQYKNNAQFVRDLRQDDMDRQKDEDAAAGIKPLNYGAPADPPKRRPRKVLVEEEKTDV